MFDIITTSLSGTCWVVGVYMEDFGMEECSNIKAELICMIESINDLEFLRFTYKFVKRLKENWGI